MTTTTSTSATIAVAEPVFTNAERLALAGFLAGYTGLTREAYAPDLRQFTAWPGTSPAAFRRGGPILSASPVTSKPEAGRAPQ